MTIDVKGVIAIIILIGAFALVGAYVYRGQVPDVAVMGVASGAIFGVMGFYFGHINGAATALAQNATALASQAITAAQQRRVTDPVPAAVVTLTAAAVPSSTATAPNSPTVPGA